MLHLNHLIYRTTSISDQQIYIASPPSNLIHFSSDRLHNIRLTSALNQNDISPEFLIKFNKDHEKFKRDHEKFIHN
jgi:hypothetical protein